MLELKLIIRFLFFFYNFSLLVLLGIHLYEMDSEMCYNKLKPRNYTEFVKMVLVY